MKTFSILAWFTMAVTSLIISPFFLAIWLLTFWWDRRRVITHFVGTFWAWHYQSLVPFWKLTVEGREIIPWNDPVVLVANHRSLVDILALYKLRRPFKWTSKEENFRLPFVGMVLSLTNAIRVRRGDHRTGISFISRALEEIEKGSSVLLFPEGTRSRKKQMRPFKEGAFLLAKKARVPIIPVVHTGSENTFPEGRIIPIGRAHIRIRVLEEIPLRTVEEMSVQALLKYTRQRMENGLRELEES